jgi:hypothetical protein
MHRRYGQVELLAAGLSIHPVTAAMNLAARLRHSCTRHAARFDESRGNGYDP